MKYPVLIIGIVLFVLYITNPRTKEYWANHYGKMKPSTCRVIKDRFEKNTDFDWEIKCLTIKIMEIKMESEIKENDKNYRALMYRELANALSVFGQKSNPETMDYLKTLYLELKHPQLTIAAQTDGAAVNQIAKTKNQKDLLEFLRLTVKVKEVKK